MNKLSRNSFFSVSLIISFLKKMTGSYKIDFGLDELVSRSGLHSSSWATLNQAFQIFQKKIKKKTTVNFRYSLHFLLNPFWQSDQ